MGSPLLASELEHVPHNVELHVDFEHLDYIDHGDDGAGVLHLGAAYSFGDPANDRVRYRTQPEFFISETGGVDLASVGVPAEVPLFVDTGGIAANNFNLFGLEAGTAIGSWHVQSELLYMVVNQIGGPTVTF